MIQIIDNPEGCVCPNIRGDRTCRECYYSQVDENKWTGSRKCWEAQCLVAGPETDPLYTGVRKGTPGR
jgi:hypothetical protein